ncbi:uncharacterized protein LOC125489900 [Plutella xylostella]|uniref:uncharacterized protein LOC125489900 n=1 Tax=Plutella xylostella TaxID=51655 RepID=UPI0020326536|nr:uncharacterized protein LOC125489900 [Plutella xylostella]
MSCCVPGCNVRFTDGVPLHRFPNPKKEIERFRVWILRVGGDIIGLTNEVIVKNRRVCHRHFEERFFYPKNRLSKLAIPTLDLPMLPRSGGSTNSTRPVPEPMEIEGTVSSTTSLAPSIQSQTQCGTSCSTSAVPSCSTSAVDVS